ncbi:glutathione S-transferase [Gloeophyllum trabeum ATCC 11539]|uniref:Glutathione S-transferase n=1 Tax=Gloeophyllum trabeum (strain ATCC 11539 / FP-39264 / Madison 617) TaxID=670483 RepID=S7PXW3_GLOTA|nr:glutathione S-transferase [Gloeophyllum trabeum ATCC 11539]EPQ52461.1 glutathione S-transferase [Gloeophyllum trabeum ATCC 11539]
MLSRKQFTLYTHKTGVNGWKVALLLEELGLYGKTELKYLEVDDNKNEVKASPHIDLNPNGRIPTLVDHSNNDFVIWESCAILLYLVEKYDKGGGFTVSDHNEKYKQLQWLFFQASGQGPYFGQISHFLFAHPVIVPTAVQRYQDEIKRVIGVLECVMSEQEWLVAGKFTIVDIALFPWHDAAIQYYLPPGTYDLAKEAPHVNAWYKMMLERPSVKKVWGQRDGFLQESPFKEGLAAAHQRVAEAANQK